jgi:hypothetical protein
VVVRLALSSLCKINEYINSQIAASAERSAFSHCIRTSEPGLPDSYKSPYTKPLPSVCYTYFTEYSAFKFSLRGSSRCEIHPENPLNKYNRTLDKAFVDGRFCVFAVIRGILVNNSPFTPYHRR